MSWTHQVVGIEETPVYLVAEDDPRTLDEEPMVSGVALPSWSLGSSRGSDFT